MAELITGKVTGNGPVKTAPYPHGADIAYLAHPGDAKPSDLGTLTFLTILPLVATIDKSTLDTNWVKITTPLILGQVAWCELSRFTPNPPTPPSGNKSNLIIDWDTRTVTVTPVVQP